MQKLMVYDSSHDLGSDYSWGGLNGDNSLSSELFEENPENRTFESCLWLPGVSWQAENAIYETSVSKMVVRGEKEIGYMP